MLRAMWAVKAQLQRSQNNINNWGRDHFCDTLAKNVTGFGLKNLPEANPRSLRLISLAEEISGQPSIDCATWLGGITFLKAYGEKISKQNKKKYRIEFEEKKKKHQRT